MQRFENIEFDFEPQPIEVYKSSVDVFSRREKKDKVDPETGETMVKWECDFDRYDADEYIKLQMANNMALQKQLDDTQLALCDVYELILGGV